MKVLIIGGTRYMGRVAVQRLLERGDSVTVFSRGNVQPEWWDQVAHIPGDRKDRADFSARLKGKTFDAVIDTQAFQKEDVESSAEVFRGNVGRYLMVSTGSVYLDGKLDFSAHCPFRESDVDWRALDYTYPEGEDPYGVGKRHCEKWLCENSPMPYTIIRVPAVMGWDDPTGRMWWWVQRALDGKGVLIPMEHRAPFRTLYMEDAASNFLRALDSPRAANRTYHIATQEVLTPERWAGLIYQAAGHECRITYVPEQVIRSQEVLNAYAPPLTRPIPYIHDLSRAEDDFGFQTTPVAQWIQRTVDWYRENPPSAPSKGYEHREAEGALMERWNPAFERFVSQF
ncbi:MAG: NAD-dependent epimerase/dehydratase family protein [Candidatus Latescibacteria bacterium]|nr:NAD-dependent epimerase/dehydratase family protein [Candidatus Latescibacterota bacterium]